MNNLLKAALFAAATMLTACGDTQEDHRTAPTAQAPVGKNGGTTADLIRVDLGNNNGSGGGGLIRVDLGGGRWCNRGYCPR